MEKGEDADDDDDDDDGEVSVLALPSEVKDEEYLSKPPGVNCFKN